MGSIIYLNGSANKTEASWSCRKKATNYHRAASMATDPRMRLRYWHLAKLWHEIAGEAERKTNGSSALDGGAVIIPMPPQKRSSSRSIAPVISSFAS